MIQICSKTNIRKSCETLYERLYVKPQEFQILDNSQETDINLMSTEEEQDIFTEYNNALEILNPRNKEINTGIINELKCFEATLNRTENINKLYHSILTIPATSVQAERVFSDVGHFATKFRSSLLTG